jgi:hypothetical protein
MRGLRRKVTLLPLLVGLCLTTVACYGPAKPSTAPLLRFSPAVDPPARVPAAELIDHAHHDRTTQAGTAFTSEWIVNGAVVAMPEQSPVPWPPAASTPRSGLRIRVATSVPPTGFEVRFFAEKTSADGVPLSEEGGVDCSQQDLDTTSGCRLAPSAGSLNFVLAPLPRDATRIVVSARWFVPDAYSERLRLPADAPKELSAAWVFHVGTD